MSWRRIGHLWWFDLTHSLFKLKGLFLLVPYAAFWYLMLRLIHDHLPAWMHRQESLVFAYALLDPSLVNKLLVEHPPSLSVYYALSLTTLPLFAICAGIDQLASDLGTGYFRLLSTRCRRSEIFIGRYLSAFSLLAAAVLLSSIAAAAIAAARDDYPLSEVLVYLAQIGFILLLYAAALVAYTAIVSALSRSAIGAFFFALFLYLVIVLCIWIGGKSGPGGEWLRYLLPGSLKPDLLLTGLEATITAALCLPLYVLAYGWMGWRCFRRSNY